MSLRPLHNRVIVRAAEHETETKSGLSIVSHWNPDVSGTVISVGDGLRCPKCGTREHVGVKAGDKIIFPYTAGEEVTVDNDDVYLVLRSDDIVAVVEN